MVLLVTVLINHLTTVYWTLNWYFITQRVPTITRSSCVCYNWILILCSRPAEAHPASYPMGTSGSFPWGKGDGAWSWPLTSSSAEVKNRGAISPLPHNKKNWIPWPWSGSELYRPSHRRLSAKLVPTSAGSRVLRGQRKEISMAVNLGFSRPEPLLFHSSSSSYTMLQTGRSRVQVPMRWIFLNWPNTSGSTMALGSTQPLTEMSTKNL
jgi:hypothetical protein